METHILYIENSQAPKQIFEDQTNIWSNPVTEPETSNKKHSKSKGLSWCRYLEKLFPMVLEANENQGHLVIADNGHLEFKSN